MNITQFGNEVVKEIKKIVGDTAEVILTEQERNNGVILHMIQINTHRNNMTPNINLENFLGENVEVAAKKIVQIDCQAKKSISYEQLHVEEVINDFDLVKDKIYFRIINKKMNQKLLASIPHEDWNDLAIVYSISLSNESSTKVTNKLVDNWGVSEDEIKRLAKENTPRIFPAKVKEMNEVLEELDFDTNSMRKVEGVNMYVFSNEHASYGASVVLYDTVLQEIKKIANKWNVNEVYLIPSSIHEMIGMPSDNSLKVSELTQMIQEVNQYEIPDTEILGEHVYIYHADTNTIDY